MSRPLPAGTTDKIKNFLGTNFNELGEGFRGKTAEQILGKDGAAELMLEIESRVSRGASVEDVLKNITTDMNALAELSIQQDNLERQAFEIKDHELHPAKVRVRDMGGELNKRIAFTGAARSGYDTKRGDVPIYASSIYGGSEEARMAVRTNSVPMQHMGEIPATYRNLVMDLRGDVDAEKEIARRNLLAKLRGKPNLTEAQEKYIKKTFHANRHRVVSNLAEAAGYKSMEFLNWAGRGLITKSDPAKDSRWQVDFMGLEKELIARDRNILDGKHGTYLKALKKYYEALAQNGNMPLTPQQFSEIQKMISDEIAAEGKIEADRLAAFDKKVNELNEEMFAKVKDLVKKDDQAWPYHIAQAILIFSPFGFFNYMVPVANILGPIFAGSGTFGQHLAQVADNVPLFGDIFHAMRLDFLVENIIDHTPGIAQLTNAMNAVIQTDVAQNLFGVVSPMVTGSPLIPIAIALGFSTNQLSSDIERWDKSSTTMKDGKKKLEAEFKKLRESFKNDDAKKRVAEFTLKELQANIMRHLTCELGEFLARADAAELAIFDDLPFGVTNLIKMKEAGVLNNQSKALEVLFDERFSSREIRETLLQRYLVYDKMRADKFGPELPTGNIEDQIQELVYDFKIKLNSKEGFSKLSQAEYKKRSDDVIIQTAEDILGLRSIHQGEEPEERALRAQDYQLQIIEARTKSRINMADILQVDPKKAKPSGSPKPELAIGPLGPQRVPLQAKL